MTKEACRLSLFYASAFTVLGIYLPFWPLWLESRGCDGAQIGVLLSIGIWVRTFAGPLLAQSADRTGRRRQLIRLCAWSSLASFALFFWAHSFAELCVVATLFGLCYPPMIPLVDDLTMTAARGGTVRYGHVRLWGSAAFLLASVLAGGVLEGRSAELTFWLLVSGLLLTVGSSHLLPSPDAGAARPPGPAGSGVPGGAATARGRPIRTLLRQPLFVLALLSIGLVQASHAAYYAFSALLWQDAGISRGAIGLLWAEGVVAEILLFAFGGGLAARLGPIGLLCCGVAGALVRWLVTANSTDLAVLASVQWLHALSFGATHLAAMLFIAHAVPHRMSATAQSLQASVSVGAAMALSTTLAGALFERHGGGAFYAMALLAALGGAGGIWLGTRWRGGGIVPDRDDGAPQSAGPVLD